MYADSYKHLAETMRKAFAPISATYLESSQKSIEALNELVKKLAHPMSPCFSAENLNTSLSYLTDLCKSIASNLTEESVGSFDFIDEINFQDEYVELTEAECNSINKLMEVSGTAETPVVPKKKYPSIGLIIAILSLILSLYDTFGTTSFQKELIEKLDKICDLLNEPKPEVPQPVPEYDLPIQESDFEAPDFYKM